MLLTKTKDGTYKIIDTRNVVNRKIFFPKELELSTQDAEAIAEAEKVSQSKKGWDSAIQIVDTDTGVVSNYDVANIPDIETIIPTGTFDAPQKDIKDCIDEEIIIMNVMDMSKGEFGNVWFLALCADPDADLQNDEKAFFTLPFGGSVSVKKLAKIAGYNVTEKEEGDKTLITALHRNMALPNRLPVRAKIVQTQGSTKGRNPYIDLVSPAPKAKPETAKKK